MLPVRHGAPVQEKQNDRDVRIRDMFLEFPHNSDTPYFLPPDRLLLLPFPQVELGLLVHFHHILLRRNAYSESRHLCR